MNESSSFVSFGISALEKSHRLKRGVFVPQWFRRFTDVIGPAGIGVAVGVGVFVGVGVLVGVAVGVGVPVGYGV